MDTKRTCSGCQKPLAQNAPDGLCPGCLIKAGLGTGVDIGPDSQGENRRTSFVAPAPEEVARLFPQLEILGFLGQGGMGAVYQARQKELDRVVALKILPPGIGKDPAFAQRFAGEAKALAKLNHPGIVTLYEFGQADGLFYFLMEFVDGVNLRHLLETGRLSPREALAIVPQICDALQYAHDQGIVHRDIKPENILLDRKGRVKVADFGLAKLVGTEGEPSAVGGAVATSAVLTETGTVMGTPQYMAPEQREHPTEVDHRADIYSLGAVFYQMLTGELPGKPIEPPSRRVQVDVRLDQVVLRALEKEPQRRYQQVSQVKTAVEMIASDETAPASARTVSPTGASLRTSWLRPIVMVGRRSGKAVIHWPGVLLVFILVLALAEAGAIFASTILTGTIQSRAVGIAFGFAVVFMGMLVRRGRMTPVEKLMSLDRTQATLPSQSMFSFRSGKFSLAIAIFGVLIVLGAIANFNFVLGIEKTAMLICGAIVLAAGCVGLAVTMQGALGRLPVVLGNAAATPAQREARGLRRPLLALALVVAAFLVPIGASIVFGLAAQREARLTNHKKVQQREEVLRKLESVASRTQRLDAEVTAASRAASEARSDTEQEAAQRKLAALRSEREQASKEQMLLSSQAQHTSQLIATPYLLRPAPVFLPVFFLFGLIASRIGWQHLIGIRQCAASLGEVTVTMAAALLAPIAVLNGLVLMIVAGPFTALRGPDHEFFFGLAMSVGVVLCILLDVWVIWRTWRWFRNPAAGSKVTGGDASQHPPPERRRAVWPWIAGAATIIVLAPAALVTGRLLLALYPGEAPASAANGTTKVERIVHSGGVSGETRVVRSGEREALAQAIQCEIGRRLTEGGASYSNLDVLVSDNMDSARVSFQGLHDFKSADGTVSGSAGGHFTLSRTTNGEWKGELGGRQFTVERSRLDAGRVKLEVAERALAATVGGTNVPVNPLKAATSAAVLAEPPQLRFLAWQDENLSWQEWRAWRPNGGHADTKEERGLMLHHPPTRIDLSATKEGRGVRVLFVWFSHPDIQRRSVGEMTMTDATGQTISPCLDGQGGAIHAAKAPEGELGWAVRWFAPARNAVLPPKVNLTLKYNLGDWQFPQVTVTREMFAGTMATEWGSIAGAGETLDGKAFVSLVRNMAKGHDRQVDFEAETTDGRLIEPTGTVESGPPEMRHGRFQFEVPLQQVKEFRLRTCPIRTVEYRNVSLQAGHSTEVQVSPVSSSQMETAAQPDLATAGTKAGREAASDSSAFAQSKVTLIKGKAAPPSGFHGVWPCFRGPHRDMISTEAMPLAKSWPKGGPRLLWKTNLAEGFAAAGVFKGRVYVLDYDDYDTKNRANSLRCLSLADGQEVWRINFPGKVRRNHGVARTIPAVTEKYVVALSPDCQVVCCDALTGELRWHTDLVQEFNVTVPEWYAGQCPLIDGDRVILGTGGDALVLAVDLATGKPVWQTPNPRQWRMTHSSITPVEFMGQRMYVYCASGGVAGISADDGRLLWETTDWTVKTANVPSPVSIGDGRVFLSGGYNAGSMMIQLEDAGDHFAVKPLFRLKAETFGASVQTPVFYRDHLFGVRQDGQLVCLDLTGKVLWESGAASRFGNGPFLLAQGMIFVMNDDGLVTLAEASTNAFTKLAQAKVLEGPEAWGPMALADGRLILRDFNEMICLDLTGMKGVE